MNVPVAVQVVGLALVLCGLFLLAGLAWALVAGGSLVTAWGVVAEVGRARSAGQPRRRPEGDA